MNFRALVLAPVLWSALAVVAGCRLPPVARPYPPPTAAELFAQVQARAKAVLTQRTETKVDYLAGSAGRIKVRITFVTEAPDHLRMEAESPFAGSVASLASDGLFFQFLDLRANRFLVGTAAPCNIAHLLRIALRPSDVVAVLGGAVPILDVPAEERAVDWDPGHGGREVLKLRAGDGSSETIWLDSRGRSWDIVEAELRDTAGKVVWHIQHSDYALVEGGVRLPSASEIRQPSRGADAAIRYRSRELGITPPPGVFHLDPPPGIAAEQVTCN